MEFSTLFSILLTGASTGLTCGLTCGVCGNPMVNVFLAGYLFTHGNQVKKSLVAFAGYHTGKAMTVSVLCMLISWFGGHIVNEQGEIFGINLQRIVNIVMLLFVSALIFRWFSDQSHKQETKQCSGRCQKHKEGNSSFGAMLLYGAISGLSPCTSLLLVLSYATVLNTGEAILVGMCFSLANSLIPLLLLTVLTGLLSEQMHKEIPGKIRYLQLAVYVLFAGVLIKNLLFAN
ncbi:MAG: sulfite exporter TauE/SafE family protein [Lachnospiraceae bacterium]|nr:sulfite exporter TauE/SafE family protein [Lachnospiraceae bacterium]